LLRFALDELFDILTSEKYMNRLIRCCVLVLVRSTGLKRRGLVRF